MVKLLALAMGDRYGAGPELVAGVVEQLPRAPWLRIVVVGDRAVFDRARAALGLSLGYPLVLTLEAMRNSAEPWALLERPFGAPVGPFGRATEAAGRESLETLGWLAERLASHRIDAAVYAPVGREALALAGYQGDEADIFRERLRLAASEGGQETPSREPRVRLPLGKALPIATTRGDVGYAIAGTGRAEPDELLAAIGVVVRKLDVRG